MFWAILYLTDKAKAKGEVGELEWLHNFTWLFSSCTLQTYSSQKATSSVFLFSFLFFLSLSLFFLNSISPMKQDTLCCASEGPEWFQVGNLKDSKVSCWKPKTRFVAETQRRQLFRLSPNLGLWKEELAGSQLSALPPPIPRLSNLTKRKKMQKTLV
jgi:hypothetical protein